jgi:hypothetical protein
MLDGITAANNNGTGAKANSATVLLGNSTVTMNKGNGLGTTGTGTIVSYKNNLINGNAPVDGTPIPPQTLN